MGGCGVGHVTICGQVTDAMHKMAKVVDAQNANDRAYVKLTADRKAFQVGV